MRVRLIQRDGRTQQTIGDAIESSFSDTPKTGLASKVGAIQLI
jgi:hypothetical protein